MDTISRAMRSRVMAQVRSQRNRSTEWRLRASLIQSGIRGWKLNPPDILGKPDFAFLEERLLLFVDGCYWHGCPKCYRRPSSNTDYWDAKVARNRARDAKTVAQLKRQEWRLLRIWEHQLTTTAPVIAKIRAALGSGQPKSRI
jgi:DNA mismatch endonuclease, patch repair protein